MQLYVRLVVGKGTNEASVVVKVPKVPEIGDRVLFLNTDVMSYKGRGMQMVGQEYIVNNAMPPEKFADEESWCFRVRPSWEF